MLKHRLIAFIATTLLLFAPVSNAQKAPVFSLPGDGVTHDLSKLKGKVVYIDQTAAGDESSDTTTINIDYDLFTLGCPGGRQGIIDIESLSSSTKQSS